MGSGSIHPSQDSSRNPEEEEVEDIGRSSIDSGQLNQWIYRVVTDKEI